MTFAELFEWIEKHNVDWNSEIYYERIEDHYFKKGTGWTENSLKVRGEDYHRQVQLNEKITSGEFYNKEQYPLIDEPEKFKMTEDEMEYLKDEYVKVETFIFDPEYNNKIFLTAHF